MRVIAGLDALDRTDLRAQHGDSIEARSAVLVGVFDGVHLGHQRLLHELLELASEHEALPTVVTFENHPDELLRGRRVEWITSFPHRLRLLRRAGVRRVVALRFDERLRALDAAAFTDRVLVRGLQTKALLIGYDAAIGRDRGGTVERMTELGRDRGFAVRQGSPFLVDGRPVSSTAIRDAITRGHLAQCHRLLGRWPTAFGTVERGAGRGRGLGFPTANVQPQSLILPPAGVYAVEVLLDGEQRDGVANLGPRPTFDGEGAGGILEVHLFDFDRDLYDQTLEVGFVARLRGQKRFDTPAALQAQIGADVAAARAALRAC